MPRAAPGKAAGALYFVSSGEKPGEFKLWLRIKRHRDVATRAPRSGGGAR